MSCLVLSTKLSLFSFFFDFFEQVWAQQGDFGLVINHDQVLAFERLVLLVLVFQLVELDRLLEIGRFTWKGEIGDWANSKVFEPGDDPILEIVKPDAAVRTANYQIAVLDLQNIDTGISFFLLSFRLVGVVHQVHHFDGPPFFGLGVVLHNQRNIPHYYKPVHGACHSLGRVRNKNSLRQIPVLLKRRTVILESLFSTFPTPENGSPFPSGREFLIVLLIEPHVVLEIVHPLVHFSTH